MLPPSFQTDITTMATGSLPLPAQLVRRSGQLVSTEQVRVSLMASPSCDTDHSLQVLTDSPVLALYFSAHWCPPCRQFTPLLARAHAQAKQAGLADKARLNNPQNMNLTFKHFFRKKFGLFGRLLTPGLRWRWCLSAATVARRT